MNDYFSGLQYDDFWPLRARQLYDPNQLNAQAHNMPMPEPMAEPPHTEISNAYRQALMQIPQQHSPGKLRTIAAMMAGLGAGVGPSSYQNGSAVGFNGNPKAAFETTDLVRNAPYYREMDQYNARTKALGVGANIEERQNNDRARSADQSLLRNQQAANAQETAQHHRELEGSAEQLRARQQQDADTRLANSRLNEFKAKNPHSIIRESNGGLVAINPLTNESTDLGIDTGKLDDTTKLKIQLHNQLAEIEARIQGQKEVEGIRQTGRQNDIESRGSEARKTKSTPTATTRSASETVKTTKDSSGKVKETVITRTGPTSNTVLMRGPDGRTYQIPSDKVEDAKKNQMTVVQ